MRPQPVGLATTALLACSAAFAILKSGEVRPHGPSSRAHGAGIAPHRHAMANGRRADRAGADHGRVACRPSRVDTAARRGPGGSWSRSSSTPRSSRRTRTLAAIRGAWPPISRRSPHLRVDLVWAPSAAEMYPEDLPPKSSPKVPPRPAWRTSFARISSPASQPWSAKLLLQVHARLRDVRREGLPAAQGRHRQWPRPRHAGRRSSGNRRCARQTASRCPRATRYLSPDERPAAPTLHRVLTRMRCEIARRTLYRRDARRKRSADRKRGLCRGLSRSTPRRDAGRPITSIANEADATAGGGKTSAAPG